ncbi:MAG: polysaccharide deacetylase family protein [Verrucomicrobiota bacterium]
MGKKSLRNVEYAALGPLRAAFSSGVPVLVYHKLGALPSAVKMKSLYVESGLFAWQMRDLKSGGFSSESLDAWRNFSFPHPARAVLTFDDGSRTVLRHAMRALAAERFTAIQFLVADAIGGDNEWDIRDLHEAADPLMDKSEIHEWLAAGHAIGAHTLTHPRLTEIPADRAREEIFASKKMLEDIFGIPIRHFCYPYGKWNRPVRDLVEEAGYETAVTLDFGVNGADPDPFALKRIGVRHPSRNFRNFLALITAGFPMRFFLRQR